MDLQHCMKMMRENGQRIGQMVAGITAEQARYKPDPATWSMLEVLGHLYDEERYDFRVRLGRIVAQDHAPWPPIDPQGWVVARAYNAQDMAEVLGGFETERAESLAWLARLTAVEWAAPYETPFGSTTAGDMLAAWVAHDVLHLRQLVELHWALVQAAVAPFNTLYAGEW